MQIACSKTGLILPVFKILKDTFINFIVHIEGMGVKYFGEILVMK